MILAVAAATFFLSGCAAQRQARFDAAIASDSPPPDFWLSVTVLRGPADTASRAAAYQRMAVATRPARYIVEADRVLRVATGSGSDETTFPAQTRQLTDAEFASLWRTVRDSALVLNDHPGAVGAPPRADAATGKTIYIVSFSAGGDRRVLATDAEPTPGPHAEDARKLVEQLAALAWME